jgi:Flp pilus assembly protein TadG
VDERGLRALRRRWTRLRAAPERGAAATELALLTPVFILLLLLVVALGRVVDARIQVDDAAHAAARAASLAATPGQAQQAAADAASQALSGDGITCSPMSVAANVGAMTPGSTARVTITCTVGLGDVSGLRVLPGRETVTASFSSVIDTYRSTGGQP